MSGNFKGFDKGTNDFLFELQFINTIEKQNKNLVKYKKYITIPINLLYLDLLEVINQINVDFETKPARCISTPYTDRRFSPNVPLKEYMYLRFRQPNRKTNILGLYFDMGCDAYGYGLKIYKPTSKDMNLLREKISENVNLLSKLIDDLILKGFEITGEKYKKDHFPDIPECSAKEYHIDDNDIESICEILKDFILPTWYIHAFSRKSLYVILQGKYFKISRHRNKSWDEMIEYGVTKANVERTFLENIPLHI